MLYFRVFNTQYLPCNWHNTQKLKMTHARRICSSPLIFLKINSTSIVEECLSKPFLATCTPLSIRFLGWVCLKDKCMLYLFRNWHTSFIDIETCWGLLMTDTKKHWITTQIEAIFSAEVSWNSFIHREIHNIYFKFLIQTTIPRGHFLHWLSESLLSFILAHQYSSPLQVC